MNRKRLVKIFTILLLSISLMGCAKAPENQNTSVNAKAAGQENVQEETKQSNTVEVSDNKKADAAQDEKEDPIRVGITLYYPSKDYIETGNEDHKYVESQDQIEAVSEEALWDHVKSLLEAAPKDDQGESFVKEGQITKLYFQDGTAFVDVDKDKLGSGGSLDEELFIGQVVKSLTSIDKVKAVQFLVNGEKADSLMGHYDTSQAFTEFE